MFAGQHALVARREPNARLVEGVVAGRDRDVVRRIGNVGVHVEGFGDVLLVGDVAQAHGVARVRLELEELEDDLLALQAAAVEQVEPLRIEADVHALQRVALVEARVADVERRVAHVGAADEAERRVEVALDLLDREAAAEPRGVRHVHAEAEGGIVAHEPRRLRLLIPRVGLENAAARDARVQEAEVRADDAVVDVRLRIAVGHDDADIGFVEHIRRDAPDEQVLRFDVTRVGLRYRTRPG